MHISSHEACSSRKCERQVMEMHYRQLAVHMKESGNAMTLEFGKGVMCGLADKWHVA
jgi:hypothetical protein